ncbi:MAG: FAD-dependent oxidoreductase [Patescibacteria group bacterium]|nr:FAD-dependent oxidoreductase [Patescibacteria group bacterium]
MYDLIIIGGGPAGITAGIYAARQKVKTLLVTKNFGGQITKKAVAIENYPGFEEITGLDLIKKFENHLRKFKDQVEIKMEEIVKVEKQGDVFLICTKDNIKFKAKTVIIATGAGPKALNIPGEEEFIGKGVSFCAVCDGAIFTNKDVAVVGGGNSGFETALFLSNIARKIYILEYGSEPKADQESQEIVKKNKKTEIITNTQLKEIKGGEFVHSLVYEDRVTKQEKTLKVEGVFVEIGLVPAGSIVKDLVDFNERNEIKVKPESCETKTPGLFAAGDVNEGKYKQIVASCGEGAKTFLAVFDYLKKHN